MKLYLGIDVGSISTNFVLMDNDKKVVKYLYLRTAGDPVQAVKKGLKELSKTYSDEDIVGCGATGSARKLTGVITGADLVKNEITAHGRAAVHFVPDVKTVFEIGGQDSKIIIIRDGHPVDFAMNSICAAGTGSFLDHQAERLKIPIEKFGELALKSKNDVNIAGRCTVFAESDMIHKQAIGHSIEDIIKGLCNSLVRNYLNNVAKGKDIQPPVVFQGGVSENIGLVKAFEEALGYKIIVPQYNTVMGAFGMALLVKKLRDEGNLKKTSFRGFETAELDIKTTSFECNGCPNRCEIIEARIEGEVISRWGDRCGKWSNI